MSTAIYLILSVFDTFCVILLGLILHRQPLMEYKYKILIVCSLISISSFLIRVILDITVIDLPLQAIYFVLFYRYMMEYKWFYSIAIALTGLGAYITLQVSLASFWDAIGVINDSVIHETVGWGVSLIMIPSILITYAFGYLFYRLNFGWSFIIRPPHDFNIQEKLWTKANTRLIIALVATAVISILTLITLIKLGAVWLFPAAVVVFVLLYYFTDRRDKVDTSTLVENSKND